ncbi:MAG TPA: substrate-binding domain-containing protein, partial [Mycobacteriales bacterium]|nr:substrate-binding domain-containing protein [Mycobacteriales bacterium]
PEALDWLGDLADRYDRAGHRVAGRCVRVELTATDGQRAVAALQSTPFPGGGEPPDAWVPQSSGLLDLVRARPGSAAVLPARAPSIASSPLVLAAPPDAITSLRLDQNTPPTLADFLRLATDPKGWGSMGHPEWGPVRFSLVDPAVSTVGTSMLVALAGASTGVATDQVTAATFGRTEAQAGLLGFVRATAVRAKSVKDLLGLIGSADSPGAVIRSLGFVALTERDVWTYDAGSPAIPLQAVYPLGGALAADYPFVIPTGRWVSRFDRLAATDFRDWLTGPTARRELAGFGLRPPDGSGAALPADGQGINPAPLTPAPAVHPDAPRIARGSWQLLTRRVLTLAVIDVSGSMGAVVPGTDSTRLELASQAARNALRFYGDQDYVGLWEFSTGLAGGADYQELVPLGPAAGTVGKVTRRQALDNAYRALRPENSTGLYDTVLAAYTAAQHAYRPDFVNTVVVLTDGSNEDSDSISLSTLLSALTRAQDPARPVHIITIAYGDRADAAVLGQIAKATGGLSFSTPDPRDIGSVFLTALTSLAD